MKLHHFKPILSWKCFLLVAIAWLSTFNARSQTTLAAGDIAFVGYITIDDGVDGTTQDDEFSFILLKDITAGTVISFTDFGWLTTNAFQTANPCGPLSGAINDGVIQWTASTNMSCGTQVRIRCRYTLQASSGTVTGITQSFDSPGSYLSLAVGGDQIFAYQNTFAAPTLLAGISINIGWDAALASCYFSSNNSIQPAALASVNNVAVTVAINGKYNCILTNDLPPNLIAAINNPANWNKDNTFFAPVPAAFQLPLSCSFSCNAGPNINAGTATGTISACFGTASASPNIQSFTVSGSSLTDNILVTAPANFEVSTSAGSGYGASVTLIQSGGSVPVTIIYVRSAATAPAGPISGNVVLTSTGATTRNVAVSGTIYAIPNAVATPSSQTVCSGSPITTIALSGAVGGTTFNWTRDNTGTVTGIAANGSGDISGTLTNTTTSPVTVTFTITPTVNGCTGNAVTATVLVNPTPTASATPASQTICSGASITTIVLSGNVGGTVFNWTRDNTGTVTGIANSGSGNISGALTNTTASPITVTFTITPVANGCNGNPITATILVNPTPDAIATPASQTICSGASITSIILSGNTGGTTFNWTRDNTGTVTGIANSGSGNISGALTNTTAGPITVTFTITPVANGCTGNAITATVLVNPVPDAVATPSSQVTCSGQAITTIVLSGAVSGTTFNWTRDNTVTVTGIANSGSGNISGALTNTTTNPITVTFTITPTANGCPGTPVTATVTVNPVPDATAAPSSQTICSGTAITTIVITGTVPGTTFNWVRNNTGTVTGIPGSGSGNISGSLTNTTNAPITVTFTITPTANGCQPGVPVTATVLVNPTPNAVATPSSQNICTGNAITPIVLTSAVSGTTFSWTRNNTVNVTGIPNSGTGNSISGTLTNNTAVQQIVQFTITPTANGCPGNPITATVTVNIPPTITCPANITVNNTPGQCGAIVNYPPATATGSPTPVITYSQASGSFFPVGTTTVTATATNICGSATCTFTITVVDNQPPTIICPANRTVNNTLNQCGAIVTYPFPTVSDNCGLPGGTSVAINQSTDPTTITPIQIGCQYFGGITAENSWWRAYDLSAYGLPAGITIKSVRFGIEKITGTSVPITARIYRQTSGTFPGGTRTLLATQTQIFAVQTATFQNIVFSTPAAATPTDVIVVELYCPDQLATGAGFFIGSNAAPETGESYLSAVACGAPNPTNLADLGFPDDNIHLALNAEYYIAPPTLVQIAGLPSGSFFPVGTTTNTFRATDGAGNTSTCSFTVTVVDAQAPSITCPANIVRNTDPGVCTASIAVPNPVFSDNCAVTQLTWAMSGATTGSSPATGINFVGTRTFNLNGNTGQGVTTIVYTIRDAAGNISTCSFTVTVNDAQLPVISQQPLTRFVCVGNNAVFTVTAAAGGGPLAYQWQAWDGTAWVNIAGATTNTYSVPNVTFADNTKSYRVVLTGLCSVVTSAAATLYVNPLPTVSLISSIPPSLTPGQSLNITAQVNPPGGSFAWYFNNVLSLSHTGPVWSNVTVDGIGTYKVVYTDPNGCTATSSDLVVSGQATDRLWVYPNPNTGQFQVRFFNTPGEEVTVNVYDSKGALVYKKVVITGPPYTNINVDLGEANPGGVYIVMVVDGSGKIIASRKIVVRHH